MAIHYDAKKQIFHLQSGAVSYILQLIEGFPVHIYWGAAIRHQSLASADIDDWNYSMPLTQQVNRLGFLQVRERSSFNPNSIPKQPHYSLDTLAQEYPQYGSGDLRHPAYQVQLQDGSRITELKYTEHHIVSGKPILEGLPATYCETDTEAQTLILTLKDDYSGLKAYLYYTVFSQSDAIARSVRFENTGDQTMLLERASSLSIDFADDRFELIGLWGAHERERHLQRLPVRHGSTRLESRRGASSHQMNPFAALVRPETSESQGDAYGISLVYSGNFCIETEVDHLNMTRVTAGINDFEFTWQLEAGQSFQTPEAVLVYSNQGLGGMSRTYHDLFRTRLCRGVHRDAVRPILVNNWEATYFNFNEAKIEAIAQKGADLGIELMVLDDGWFGHRDADNSSLGDWYVHPKKLPNGLYGLAERIQHLGMQFGLWVEPEMISPDSDLYRQHPDWCLHVPGRRRTEGRRQLILDLSRTEVVDYLYETLSTIFSSAPISYVKWDMNRNFSEAGSASLPAAKQKEVAHRYILGLYELLERLTSRFPQILFESCSGGGGRFDPGMLYYMPQTWTSDNSDAIERLKIQYGTSLVYPLSTIGAHVTAVPNHQVQRLTSLKLRGDVAMSGNFGYELDLTQMNDEEQEIVREQTQAYKEIRQLIQKGDFYRLLSPFEGNYTAWMVVSKDKREAVVFYFRILAEPNPALKRLKLQGLKADFDYRFDGQPQAYGGDLLMQHGWAVPHLLGDFTSVWFKLTAV